MRHPVVIDELSTIYLHLTDTTNLSNVIDMKLFNRVRFYHNVVTRQMSKTTKRDLLSRCERSI